MHRIRTKDATFPLHYHRDIWNFIADCWLRLKKWQLHESGNENVRQRERLMKLRAFVLESNSSPSKTLIYHPGALSVEERWESVSFCNSRMLSAYFAFPLHLLKSTITFEFATHPVIFGVCPWHADANAMLIWKQTPWAASSVGLHWQLLVKKGWNSIKAFRLKVI